MNTIPMTAADRQQAADAEYQRMASHLQGQDDDRRAAFDKLLREAAFVAVTLEELRHIISTEGTVETYKNGANQYGQKVSAAVTTYDKLLNTYSKIMGQISKELPVDDSVFKLMNFLK